MKGGVFGGVHGVGRLRRGFVEFLMLPMTVAAVFCAVAIFVSVLDRRGGTYALRQSAEMLLAPTQTAGFVSSVAASLLTVTSITFSVLLVAVQQTATSLSAVVFDQYLRRRSNQLYLGYFVGATAFCFIVEALGRPHPAPVYGAFSALLLTVGSLVALLLLIHSTVDQMRPESVVRSIHELALRAHARELKILTGTRQTRQSPSGTDRREVTATDDGYVVHIDVNALAEVAKSLGSGSEILVDCQLGTYVIVGQPLVHIIGLAASNDAFDKAVLDAFSLSETRQVESDCGYCLDQLENIAWMAGSSAAQSPFTTQTALTALRDLAARWSIKDRQDDSHTIHEELLPVVYEDGVLSRILQTFGTLLVAASESRQTRTAAAIISSFAQVLPRLHLATDRAEFERVLTTALPCLHEQTALPVLAAALDELRNAQAAAGLSTRQVADAKARLRKAPAHRLFASLRRR